MLALLCASSVYGTDQVALQEQVAEAEIAFAQTMADRDFDAFKTFLSKEAVFVSGNSIARGRAQIAEQWSAYYVDDQAPFSWRPELVVVLDSGDLALSTGPVFDASGQLVSYYNSTWRKED
jgi:ketosteroid isomerase-like protein